MAAEFPIRSATRQTLVRAVRHTTALLRGG
jgi:hypothetical protein